MIDHLKMQVVMGRAWHTGAALLLLLLFIFSLTQITSATRTVYRAIALVICVLSFACCLHHARIADEAWHQPVLYLWHYSK